MNKERMKWPVVRRKKRKISELYDRIMHLKGMREEAIRKRRRKKRKKRKRRV